MSLKYFLLGWYRGRDILIKTIQDNWIFVLVWLSLMINELRYITALIKSFFRKSFEGI